MSPYPSIIMQCTEEEYSKSEHPKQEETKHARGSVLTIGAADGITSQHDPCPCKVHVDMSNLQIRDQTFDLDCFSHVKSCLKLAKETQNKVKQCEKETECKVELHSKSWNNNDGSEKHEKEVQEKEELEIQQHGYSETGNSDEGIKQKQHDNSEIVWNNRIVEDAGFVKAEDALVSRTCGFEQTNSLEKHNQSNVNIEEEEDSSCKDAKVTGVQMPNRKPHNPRRKRRHRRTRRRKQLEGLKFQDMVGCYVKSCSVPGILQATGGSNKAVKTSNKTHNQNSYQCGRRRSGQTMYQYSKGGGGDGGCGGEPPPPPHNFVKQRPSCDGDINNEKQPAKQRPAKLIMRQASHSSLPSPIVHGTPFISRQSPCFSLPPTGVKTEHFLLPAFEHFQMESSAAQWLTHDCPPCKTMQMYLSHVRQCQDLWLGCSICRELHDAVSNNVSGCVSDQHVNCSIPFCQQFHQAASQGEDAQFDILFQFASSFDDPSPQLMQPLPYPIQRVQSLTEGAAAAGNDVTSAMEAYYKDNTEVSTLEVVGIPTAGSRYTERQHPSVYTGDMLEPAPSFRQTARPSVPVNSINKAAFIDHLMDKPYHTRQELLEDEPMEMGKSDDAEADEMWRQCMDEELPKPIYGKVAYGENRHLRAFLQYWESLQRKLKGNGVSWEKLMEDDEEGIIFVEGLRIQAGNYREGDEYWQMEGLLGAGTFGKVYLCKDNNTGYEFVVKKVDLKHFNPNEALIWSELCHPGIVRLLGVIRTGATICFYSASVAKRTLKSLVNNGRVLSQGAALQYMEQLLGILVYVHEMAVLHKDLKPENVLVTGEGRCLLIDWGLAKLIKRGQLVKSESVPEGTQQYMAPEVARSEDHDYGVDIWSLMCIGIQLISGSPPWVKRFPDTPLLFFKIGTAASPPLEDIPEDTHPEVKSLLAEGMAIEPNNRPSAATLLQHPAFNLIQELQHVQAVNLLDIAQCKVPPGSTSSGWQPYFAEVAGNDSDGVLINNPDIPAINMAMDQNDYNCPFKSDLDTLEDQLSITSSASQKSRKPEQAEQNEEVEAMAIQQQTIEEESTLVDIALPEFNFHGLPKLPESESNSQHQPHPSNRQTEKQSNQDEINKHKILCQLSNQLMEIQESFDSATYASVDSNMDLYGPSLTEDDVGNITQSASHETNPITASTQLPLSEGRCPATDVLTAICDTERPTRDTTVSTQPTALEESPASDAMIKTQLTTHGESPTHPLTSEDNRPQPGAIPKVYKATKPQSLPGRLNNRKMPKIKLAPCFSEAFDPAPTHLPCSMEPSTLFNQRSEVCSPVLPINPLMQIPPLQLTGPSTHLAIVSPQSTALEESLASDTMIYTQSIAQGESLTRNLTATCTPAAVKQKQSSTTPPIDPVRQIPTTQSAAASSPYDQWAQMSSTVPPIIQTLQSQALGSTDTDRRLKTNQHHHEQEEDSAIEIPFKKMRLMNADDLHGDITDSLSSLGGRLEISVIDESQEISDLIGSLKIFGDPTVISEGLSGSPQLSVRGDMVTTSTPLSKTNDIHQFLNDDDDDMAIFQGLGDMSATEDIPCSDYTDPPLPAEDASISSYATAPPPDNTTSFHRRTSVFSADEIEQEYFSLAASNCMEQCYYLDNPDAQQVLMTEAIELRSQISQVSSHNGAATPNHGLPGYDTTDKYNYYTPQLMDPAAGTSGVYTSSLNSPLMSMEGRNKYVELQKQLSTISSTGSSGGAGIKVTVDIGNTDPICIQMRHEQCIGDLAKGICGKIPNHVSRFSLQTESGIMLSDDHQIGAQDMHVVMHPIIEDEYWIWYVERRTGNIIYHDTL